MAARENHPFAISLEVEFLDRLSEPVREGKAKSVSQIIRAALERYDLDNVVVVRSPHVTVSVRLPIEIRQNLTRAAREKHTSVGQLVRSAVENYLPQLEAGVAGQLEMKELAAEATSVGRSKSARKKPAAKPAKPAKAPSRQRAKTIASAKPRAGTKRKRQ